MKKKWFPYLLILLLAGVVYLLRDRWRETPSRQNPER
jgi:hypothetical protein